MTAAHAAAAAVQNSQTNSPTTPNSGKLAPLPDEPPKNQPAIQNPSLVPSEPLLPLACWLVAVTVRGPSLGDEPHFPAYETIHAERDEQSQAETV